MSEKPILIVDGLSLFIRQFVANPSMNTKGEAAGGIVGFLGSLQWLVGQLSPKMVIVVWEGGGSRRRRAIFPEYKEKRRPQKLNRYYENDIPNTIDNRNHQVSTIVALLKNVSITQMYVEDCEADDVIGYLCRRKFPSDKKIILSSDKDFYQLIDEHTKVYSPNSKLFMGPTEVLEKFQITPRNFCLAKAVCGDPSDNIPGIEGVGFKTFAKRFQEIGTESDVTIAEIIEKANENRTKKKAPKIYNQIVEGESIIRRNWSLMYLDTVNLSASQIKKIDNTIDKFEPKRDKMGLLREVMKEGLITFDADRFFFTLSYLMNS